ncbi:MAG: patatin-like phospholipase family protein [Hyphomicrobiaceae bacterium]
MARKILASRACVPSHVEAGHVETGPPELRMSKALVDPRSGTPLVAKSPRIGLVLGGGGARGIAHIVAIEALEEMGFRPAAIAGTSIGAMFGAAAAAGLSAAFLRAHLEETFSKRLTLVRQLFSVRAPVAEKLFNLVPFRSALLDAEALLDIVMPMRVPETFAGLKVPLQVVATDIHSQDAAVLSEGSLRRAIAASIALPVIFQPVRVDGRIMMDGGMVDPLPFDRFSDPVDFVIAIDVSGGGLAEGSRKVPGPIEALTTASLILQRSIIREKLRSSRPDILIDMPARDFAVLEFHRWREILDAALPAKEQLKTRLARILRSETVTE